MFEPVRGGTRGGQGEFKWSDVSADKDRENYLGHSINAPTGRWQKNKDVHWYKRELPQTETERQAEIRKVKEAEEDALAVALGFAPVVRNNNPDAEAGSPAAGPSDAPEAKAPDDIALTLRKAEKRRLKLEKRAKKAEKKAKREKRKGDHSRDSEADDSDVPRHAYREGHSRSRSPPRRRSRERDGARSDIRSRRSPVPRYRSRSPPVRGNFRDAGGYDDRETERERERDKRRWEDTASRGEPSRRRERY